MSTLVYLAAPTLTPAIWPVHPSPGRQETPLFLVRCPAGFPSPAADYVESGLDLNEYLIKHRASTFIFEVSGDSMRGAGIVNGDKIIVDRSVEARSGAVIVAVLNGEHTVKRLYIDGNIVELRAENPRYLPIRIKDGEELTVFGVVVGVVRKLRI